MNQVDPFVQYQQKFSSETPCKLKDSLRASIRLATGAVEFEPVGTELFVDTTTSVFAEKTQAYYHPVHLSGKEINLYLFSFCGPKNDPLKMKWIPFRLYNLLSDSAKVDSKIIDGILVSQYQKAPSGVGIYVLLADEFGVALAGPQSNEGIESLARLLREIGRK